MRRSIRAATIARGAAAGRARQLRGVPHRGISGVLNAGGRPLETPFGTIYSTNITPDVADRHRRLVLSRLRARDARGHSPRRPASLSGLPVHAFFRRLIDADLQALYAYLMAQRAVRAELRRTTRWHSRSTCARCSRAGTRCSTRPRRSRPSHAKSEQWNRGAYLVEGLGHCGACHSPRNALGAEQRQCAISPAALRKAGRRRALTSLSHAPMPWSEDELFAYLRTGHSRYHGVAAGPMAPIVTDLAGPARPRHPRDGGLSRVVQRHHGRRRPQRWRAQDWRAPRRSPSRPRPGARLYHGACAVCHEVGGLPLFGSRPSLALNSNLHSATPDNLIQVILHGIAEPASSDLGYMPAFKSSLNDAQIETLVSYLRQQFAPDKPAWTDVRETIARGATIHARNERASSGPPAACRGCGGTRWS